MTALRTSALVFALAASILTVMAGSLRFVAEQRTATVASEIVNQAFDAALHVSAPATELATAFRGTRGDREAAAAPAGRLVTVEQRIGTAMSALVRMSETQVAVR